MDLKTKIYLGIIGILLLIILLQRCNTNGSNVIKWKDSVITKHDTSYVYIKDSNHHIIPVKIDSIPYFIYTPQYIPDTANIKILQKQYQSLYNNYSSLKIYGDTLKVDSIGYVSLKDSVRFNSIFGRTYSYDLKYPIITNTVTINHYQNPQRQLYIGGGIYGNKSYPIYGVESGLLYKDRKDRVFGINTKFDMNNQFSIGISMYWKLKIK